MALEAIFQTTQRDGQPNDMYIQDLTANAMAGMNGATIPQQPPRSSDATLLDTTPLDDDEPKTPSPLASLSEILWDMPSPELYNEENQDDHDWFSRGEKRQRSVLSPSFDGDMPPSKWIKE